MPEVFCDTSPLQYLHQVDLLRILPALVGRVVIPPAVDEELAVGRRAGINLPDPQHLGQEHQEREPQDPRRLRHRRFFSLAELNQAIGELLVAHGARWTRRWGARFGLAWGRATGQLCLLGSEGRAEGSG